MERSPQGRWSISKSSNSRQVGVWKYGTTWCRWVLHSFVYSDFHQQWCPWWEVTTVLPLTGVLGSLMRFCSSYLSERKHFVTNGLVTSMFCHVFMEIQAGRIFAKEFGLHNLAGKKFWWLASSPLSFGNFAMKVVKLQLSLEWCFITFFMLEGQVIRIWKFQRWDIGFRLHGHKF